MKDGGTLAPNRDGSFAPKVVTFLKLNFSVTKRKFFSTNPTKNFTFSQLYGGVNIFSVDCFHDF